LALKTIFTFSLLFLISITVQAQQTINQDSLNRIIIIKESTRINNNFRDSFTIAVGNPLVIKQGTTLFKADSIYISNKVANKYMEAFGKVYINESDSVITTASYLKYFSDKRFAILQKNVNIKSAGGTFSSEAVEYDLNTKMATYKNGAKIISKKSVLTSKTGQYYSNSKDALFTGKVVLKGSNYDVYSDTLYYNTNTEVANFVTYTKVYNIKKKQTIETTRGFYDMKKGIASFTERTVYKEKDRTAQADQMDFNETTKQYKLHGKASIVDSTREVYGEDIDIDDVAKIYHLKGKASIIDKEKKETYRGEIIDLDSKNERYHIEGNGLYKNEKEGFVITGNYLDGDGKTGRSLATGKPVAIIKQENDSIFIAADTLYSGKLIQNTKIVTDSITKITVVDTLTKADKEKDSARRYFEGFHHVRIFSDSVQAVCDSLYYSDIDSVFRLYQNPIVWNDKNQVTGDTMYLFTENKKAKRIEVFEKGFVINLVDPKFYNQIRASKLTGYFTDGNLDSLFAKGNAEIIFYIQDEEKGFVGVDKSSASIIVSYFKDKEIYKIKWLNKYNALTTPMKEVNHEAMRLKGFNLQLNRRPKSKLELFF
jgi:lipopolysaccharide export system protein LptA